MTPNLVDSRLIWQALLDYGGLEWQKSVKRHPEQEIKILENFDRVCDKDKVLLVWMVAQNKMVLSNYRVVIRIFGTLCVSDRSVWSPPPHFYPFLRVLVLFALDSLHLFYLKRKRSQGTKLGSGSPWPPGMRK
jgi:hypothetical protein